MRLLLLNINHLQYYNIIKAMQKKSWILNTLLSLCIEEGVLRATRPMKESGQKER